MSHFYLSIFVCCLNKNKTLETQKISSVSFSMKMGVKKIKIDKVVSIGGKYYIKGENFTEYSKVTLNGETLSTIYLGPNLLGLLENVDPADAPDMKVSQIDKSSKEIVSTTE